MNTPSCQIHSWYHQFPDICYSDENQVPTGMITEKSTSSASFVPVLNTSAINQGELPYGVCLLWRVMIL